MPVKRRPPEDVEALLHRGTQWVIVYGDLMSYMMIFFLVLYSFASAKGQFSESLSAIEQAFGKENKPLTRQEIKEMEAFQSIQAFVVDQKLTTVAKVLMTEQKLRIILVSPVLFPSGSAELHRKAVPVLDAIVGALKDLPNEVTVEGYTDDVPVRFSRYTSNWELSAARSMSIVRYFINEAKISPERIAFAGYGEYRPEYPNDTEEHRAMNRRIEIIVHRVLIPYTPKKE